MEEKLKNIIKRKQEIRAHLNQRTSDVDFGKLYSELLSLNKEVSSLYREFVHLFAVALLGGV